MTTTPEQRAEWKALCEKTTKAGWSRSGIRRKLGDESCIVVQTEDGTETIAFFPIGSQQHDAYFAQALADASFTATSKAALPALISHVEALEAENARLKEALTPSGATKAAYMGEFKWDETWVEHDEDGEEHHVGKVIYVPWTTIKEIMAAVRARAAMGESE